LAIVGVINSVVSVYYYSRIIVIMYMKESPEEYVPVSISPGTGLVLCLATFGILQLGIYPDLLISLARVSVFNYR
ncbi:MAG: NADH-quinone oxidoreductase subunit N, partial [Acidobacteria bacterium]